MWGLGVKRNAKVNQALPTLGITKVNVPSVEGTDVMRVVMTFAPHAWTTLGGYHLV